MKVAVIGVLAANVIWPIHLASANVFSNVQNGEILIRGIPTCVSNNAFDFQTPGRVSPCGNMDLGKLGRVQVTNTSGDFSEGAFARLAGSSVELYDLAFPGVTFYTGVQMSGGTRTLLRFDLNRDGKFGKGDVIFDAQSFTFNQDASLRVRIDISGNFREVSGVENAGAPNERILKTPFKLDVLPYESYLGASYTTEIQKTLAVRFFWRCF